MEQTLNELKEQWYVMRVYKNEKKAEERLAGDDGLRYFIPKEQALRTYHGRKVLCSVPVIHSLVFVRASHQQIVNFKKTCYNDLQFVVWNRDCCSRYLTVPDRQMDSFMLMCNQSEKKVTFFKPEAVNINKGARVRVHGGPLDSVEGVFIKVAGKRSRQVVVIIPDIMAVRAEVEPEYLELLD